MSRPKNHDGDATERSLEDQEPRGAERRDGAPRHQSVNGGRAYDDGHEKNVCFAFHCYYAQAGHGGYVTVRVQVPLKVS